MDEQEPRRRREPPPFRLGSVVRAERLTARLVRVVLGGAELAGLAVDEPAASVRVLLPGADGLVVPEWNGNEFLLPDGSRPLLRTFTPWRLAGGELTLGIVLHGDGAASSWAAGARPGDPASVSGPGRGYRIDGTADRYVLLGDETAAPAIDQLLAAIEVPVEAHVEVTDPAALPPVGGEVTWHVLPPGGVPGEALLAAAGTVRVDAGTRVWAAGEAAAVQRLRRHFFEERGLARAQASIRGYWRRGRAGDAD